MSDDGQLIIYEDGDLAVYHGPGILPTSFENEVLIHISEESGEIVQAVAKIQRFGFEDSYPGETVTNVQNLGREIGNLLAMVHIATETGMLSRSDIQDGIEMKLNKLPKYMRHLPPNCENPRLFYQICRDEGDHNYTRKKE